MFSLLPPSLISHFLLRSSNMDSPLLQEKVDDYTTNVCFFKTVSQWRLSFSLCCYFQGVQESLNKDCVASKEPSDCFFPEEIIKNIRTPVFLVNPAYDFWQIQNVLVPIGSDPSESWKKCRLNIQACTPSQLKTLQGFRDSLLRAISEFQKSKEGGMFINSCFIHCQTWIGETWHSPNSPRIDNKTIAESVGDWYFNRRAVKQIDCPYPCNPSCYNMNFPWNFQPFIMFSMY